MIGMVTVENAFVDGAFLSIQFFPFFFFFFCLDLVFRMLS